jgi:uncharacterized protein YndB with AHSA1/START domain
VQFGAVPRRWRRTAATGVPADDGGRDAQRRPCRLEEAPFDAADDSGEEAQEAVMSRLVVATDVPTEIRMTRVFDASRRLVVRAMTEPDLIARWLGNSRSPVVAVEVDLRAGGRYRYAFRRPDGREFALVGTFLKIDEDRVVETQGLEGQPGEATITTTFVESDGRTTMTVVMSFPSQPIRDGVLATGMADGASESYDNLAALVASV